MITFTADKFEVRDANGVVRVSFGSSEDTSVAAYMFHFTRDGEYVDGIDVTMKQSSDEDFLRKLSNTYEGCHTWTFANEWLSVVSAGLAWVRFQPELEASVPECVRLAEYVREKT